MIQWDGLQLYWKTLDAATQGNYHELEIVGKKISRNKILMAKWDINWWEWWGWYLWIGYDFYEASHGYKKRSTLWLVAIFLDQKPADKSQLMVFLVYVCCVLPGNPVRIFEFGSIFSGFLDYMAGLEW